MTHQKRLADINATPIPDSVRRLTGKARTSALRLWLAHIERLRLIYEPFPVVRRLGTGSALPWGGTIVTDTFYGYVNGHRRARHQIEGGYEDNPSIREREELERAAEILIGD
jgi:hypothetical protein